MGAYEILEKLKKKRSNAEPMTVYRVLKQLMAAKLVHKIESQNVYVCCTHTDTKQNHHKTILLLCKNCSNSSEFEDTSFSRSIKSFVKKHKMEIDDTPIEIHGLCHACSQKK
jgi:Fur family zinc uptake transcriptional regulator